MTSRPSRRHRLLAAGAALCCGSLLTLPAANASTSPGWDTTQSNLLGVAASGLVYSGPQDECTSTGGGFDGGISDTDYSTQPLAVNVTKSYNSSSTSTATNSTDPTDQVTVTTKSSGTGRLRESGGRATGVDLSFNGSSTTTTTKADSPCIMGSESAVGVEAVFTLDRPTVVTIEGASHGLGSLETFIEPGATGIVGELDPEGVANSLFSYDLNRSSHLNRSTWLPAGQYTILAAGVILEINPRKNISGTGSGEIHISFGEPGSRMTRTGSTKFVKMPTSRSCSTGTIQPRITGKRKVAKRIKHVVFTGPHFVDKLVKNTHKGHKIKLRTSNSAPVTVHVRVRLRNGKLIDSTASYRQCVGR